MALVICQDIQTIIGDEVASSSQLSSTITSSILNLHNCGINKYVFVFLEDSKKILEELLSFFCCFLPDCVVQFQEEYDTSMGVGDIILAKKDLFEEESQFIVVSWRAIPEMATLQGFMNMHSTKASILVSCQGSSNPSLIYNPETDRLVETDVIPSSPTQPAIDCGVYCFQKDCFAAFESSYPSVRPTSALDVLHHINQLHSSEVEVLISPPSPQLCEVVFQPTGIPSDMCVLVDEDMETPDPLCFEVPVGTVFRYRYGTLNPAKTVTSAEYRGIPRELYIPNQTQYVVKDHVSSLRPVSLLQSSSCVILSLERWRIQSNLSFQTVSAALPARVSKQTASTLIVECQDSLPDLTIQICNKQTKQEYTITINKTELEHIQSDPSITHQDGVLRKSTGKPEDPTIELKVVVITSHRSPQSQLVSGYSQVYQPIQPLAIGHRGCGMNHFSAPSSIQQSEVENTLHSFNEAYQRGLTTIECDLQLSKDQDVMIFHDYTIRTITHTHSCIEDQPIATTSTQRLQSIPVPAPRDLIGTMPTLDELIHSTSPGLNLNLEVKYPMLGELETAQVSLSKGAYIDRMITTLEALQSNRKIYFSSFDLDLCLHLVYKQANYPVFLLLDEESGCAEVSKEQWVTFTWKTYVKLSMEKGRFRGVVAEISLLNESAVQWLHSMGLLVYCWGKDGNSKEKREYLYSIGVDAIIADTFEY